MDAKEFSALEAASQRAVAGNPTSSMQKKAFAPLAASLTPEKKLGALLHFVDRDRRLRNTKGNGDWLAWYFVAGVVGRERLPWTREDLEHVLDGVVDESRVLPPELVVRAVDQFVKEHGLDAKLKALGTKVAISMWPPGATEGANFRKAAAKLREILAQGGSATPAKRATRDARPKKKK